MAKRVLIALAMVGALAVVLAFLMFRALGHRFYVVSGTARIAPSAVRAVQLPALLCSGNGGPLESSGVYGQTLGRNLEQPPRVFCSVPGDFSAVPFEESVYSNRFPRKMHVYVWLEPHPELKDHCARASAPVITVASRDLRGHGSATPAEWPCSEPDRNGAMGYTVAFHDDNPEGREVRQIEVKPKGYPSK